MIHNNGMDDLGSLVIRVAAVCSFIAFIATIWIVLAKL